MDGPGGSSPSAGWAVRGGVAVRRPMPIFDGGVGSSSNDPAGTNPRGRKHEKPGGPRFRIGSPLLYLGLVLLGLLLFRNMFQEAGYIRVPYSEFKKGIRDGRFKRVQITPDAVRGYTTDVVGTPSRPNDLLKAPWTTGRVEDP